MPAAYDDCFPAVLSGTDSLVDTTPCVALSRRSARRTRDKVRAALAANLPVAVVVYPSRHAVEGPSVTVPARTLTRARSYVRDPFIGIPSPRRPVATACGYALLVPVSVLPMACRPVAFATSVELEMRSALSELRFSGDVERTQAAPYRCCW